MKKGLRGVLLTTFLGFICSLNVFAKNIFYTNEVGVEMTELEYNKMVSIFSERYVKTLSQEQFDKLKDGNIIDNNAVYEKTTYVNGQVYGVELITEEDYNKAPDAKVSEAGVAPLDGDYNYVETTYKRLGGTLIDSGNSKFMIIGALSWKKIPYCRSYDVFAFRYNHFSYTSFIGTQDYYVGDNYATINYDTSSPGYKMASNGNGVSMNLVDGSNITGYELTIVSDLYVNSIGYSRAHAYVAYQHAQSDVTRDQSKSYTFDISGYGNVVLFNNSTVASKYDKMAGVHLTTPI